MINARLRTSRITCFTGLCVALVSATTLYFTGRPSTLTAQVAEQRVDQRSLPRLNFRTISTDVPSTFGASLIQRAKIPGGWLVTASSRELDAGCGITFVPDPDHEWDGGTYAPVQGTEAFRDDNEEVKKEKTETTEIDVE